MLQGWSAPVTLPLCFGHFRLDYLWELGYHEMWTKSNLLVEYCQKYNQVQLNTNSEQVVLHIIDAELGKAWRMFLLKNSLNSRLLTEWVRKLKVVIKSKILISLNNLRLIAMDIFRSCNFVDWLQIVWVFLQFLLAVGMHPNRDKIIWGGC